MSNKNLRGGGQSEPRGRDPILSPCPTLLLIHYKESVCKPTLLLSREPAQGRKGPTLPPKGLCSMRYLGSWDRWVSAVRRAGATTGAWVVRYRAWRAGCGSPRGGRSRIPLAHLQEACEGDQLRPTEPGSGAARGWCVEHPGRHDRRWEQQLQRAHDLRREEGEVSPPKPCRKTRVRPGQQLHSPAERPPTGTGGHAAHREAAGLTERHLHGTSLGTLGRRNW